MKTIATKWLQVSAAICDLYLLSAAIRDLYLLSAAIRDLCLLSPSLSLSLARSFSLFRGMRVHRAPEVRERSIMPHQTVLGRRPQL